MPPGLIDTNVFVHAQTRDTYAEECLRFLEALESDSVQAQIEPLVVHELSYALPHYRRGMTRAETATTPASSSNRWNTATSTTCWAFPRSP